MHDMHHIEHLHLFIMKPKTDFRAKVIVFVLIILKSLVSVEHNGNEISSFVK